jgi:predicted hydrocarbon binding protein
MGISEELKALAGVRGTLGGISIEGPVYQDMCQMIGQNRELVERMRQHYAMFGEQKWIRPDFPNEMQILYMRERQTISFLLFPELLDMGYYIGKIIGEKFIAPALTGKNLKEIMESNLHIAEEHKYARQEIVTVDNNHAVYRNYQCADCYGFPNIGLKICCYEAGTAAGAFEPLLGRPVRVREIKCCANGDEYCEFEVNVL